VRSTSLAILARVLIGQGRMDEAERTARLALAIGSTDDFATLTWAHVSLGRALAARGDPEARTEARRAVEIAERTDMPWVQGCAWEDLGAVLIAEGEMGEARDALGQALARFERKGATGAAARVRAALSGFANRLPGAS
jgi:ATP/maltotriose-dependent transcriptional regulator MalT